MKAIHLIILLLVPAVVSSFHVAPLARTSRSHHHPHFSRNWSEDRPSSSTRRRVIMCSGSSPDENEPPLLPPADYSKDIKNTGQARESSANFGQVMTNRKLTLSFTCNVCEGRSTYKINRVAFMHGIVVVWCQECNQKHLIADNLGKMDFPEFGRNLEEYMAKKGTPVKRVVMSKEGLSHVEVQVPGEDYPEREASSLSEKGFDGASLLPGAHVGGSMLAGGPPMSFGDISGDELVGGDSEGQDGVGSDV